MIVLTLVLACSGSGDAPPSTQPAAIDPWAPTTSTPPAVHARVVPSRAEISKLIVTDANGSGAPLGLHFTNVTLLAFWASWCQPCLLELPLLDKMAAELHDPRLSVVAVNLDLDGDRSAALTWLATHHITVPVVFDPNATVYDAIFGRGIISIPATAVVSADGVDTESGSDADSVDALVASWKARLEAHAK